MKRSFKSIILFSLIAFISVTLFSGCKKTSETTAKITVRGAKNELVIGAWVRVYGKSTTTKSSIINDSIQSDYKGEAFFNYSKIYQAGQAGVAVLDVVGRQGALFGKTIIKIEAEEENIATVFIE